jgi:protein gp37
MLGSDCQPEVQIELSIEKQGGRPIFEDNKFIKMNKSSIEWTESTWNPTTGCDKVSAGCKNCYAAVMARRLEAMGNPRYANGFKLTLHPDKITEPKKWKKGRVIFVNSMSDLFHEDVPSEYVQNLFKTMRETPQHIYQILTKRSQRLLELDPILKWTPNIWMGVSVEDERVVNRIDDLRLTGAHIKFLSCEPLLGPLSNLNLEGINWLIAGGESGRKARPMAKEWVEDLQLQCANAGVAFFFKQWGGKNKKKAGRILNGRTYDEMPSIS